MDTKIKESHPLTIKNKVRKELVNARKEKDNRLIGVLERILYEVK